VAWTGTEASFTEANGPSTSGSGAQTTTQPVPLSNATSPFTISAWVNIAATNGYLIASTDEGHSGWEFRFTDTNVLRLILWSGATPVMWAGGPVTNFTTGIRQNILTTYDGSGHASGIKVYVNGTLIASTVVNDSLAGATISPTQPFTIMAEPLDGMMVNSVLGTMDHLRIFNRVLAAGDIALIQTESI
jgi:hypothetical protein